MRVKNMEGDKLTCDGWFSCRNKAGGVGRQVDDHYRTWQGRAEINCLS